MENDVLKNKIAPWQEKGRWYHGVLLTASTLDRARTDKFILDNFRVSGAGASVRTLETDNAKIRIIDQKIRFSDDAVPVSAYNMSINVCLKLNGTQFIYLSPTLSTGEADFWIFVVKY